MVVRGVVLPQLSSNSSWARWTKAQNSQSRLSQGTTGGGLKDSTRPRLQDPTSGPRSQAYGLRSLYSPLDSSIQGVCEDIQNETIQNKMDRQLELLCPRAGMLEDKVFEAVMIHLNTVTRSRYPPRACTAPSSRPIDHTESTKMKNHNRGLQKRRQSKGHLLRKSVL